MSNNRVDGKKIRESFFTRSGTDPTKSRCRYGKVRTVKRTGYSNFLSHVRASQSDALSELLETNGSTEFSATSYKSAVGRNLFFKDKTIQLHGVLDFVVSGLFLFSIVNNLKVMRHLRYNRIDVNTFDY